MVAQMNAKPHPAAHWPLALLLLLSSAGGASAMDCLQSEPSGVATVTGTGRAYFHGDAAVCPNQQAYCLKRAHVIAADRVLTSGGSQDGFTCVFFPGKNTTTTGWIETRRLRPEPVNPSPPPSEWVGAWNSEGVMRIEVSRDQGGLRAAGLADWDSGDGFDDRGTVALPGRNHHAEFSGPLNMIGDQARLSDGACAVELTLLGDFLIVEDDNSCGDGNTSFRGIYRRMP
jgi:hypothetical protein